MAKQRMERMQHVKAKLHIKASAIQIAITTLTSDLPHPMLTTYNGLRTMIKRALGQLHGAWEIVAWSLTKTPLDVEAGWVVAMLQLWREVSLVPDGKRALAKVLKRNQHSRLTSILL